jgi:hypothetical protein
MNRHVEMLRGAISAVAGRSERTLLLGTILLVSAMSAVASVVLARYYSVDVLSFLLGSTPDDCSPDLGTQIGRHCFSDYEANMGMRANPWDTGNPYPAAAMIPHLLFGLPAHWLGVRRLGLLGYLLASTIAIFTPAVWATRGVHRLERAVVVFGALGLAAVPAWAVLDRGNSMGFLVPIALVFLVALCRRRWGLVAIAVVLAALVKPQFAVLAIALFAARQWRLGGLAVAGAVTSNLAAYLLWPRDFPGTIAQSIHNVLTSVAFPHAVSNANLSFAKGILRIPDTVEGAGRLGGTNVGTNVSQQPTGGIPENFLAGARSLIGYVVLVVVVVCVLYLGRRIPPVMAGIALLATACLFPPVVNCYYLVFALPIAALVVRDPDGPPGSGIFDRPAVVGGRRRAVGVCVSLAAALTIAQVPMGAKGILSSTPAIITSVVLAPVLWLVACAAIIVSYARKPAPPSGSDQLPSWKGSFEYCRPQLTTHSGAEPESINGHVIDRPVKSGNAF